MRKVKTHRAIIGKKLQVLQTLMDMCNDFSTYDSDEKIAKLNQEFENYNKLIIKEKSSDFLVRKRKHGELDTDHNLL
jgi:hypothetical protein